MTLQCVYQISRGHMGSTSKGFTIWKRNGPDKESWWFGYNHVMTIDLSSGISTEWFKRVINAKE